MPCRTEEPNPTERANQESAQLYEFVRRSQGKYVSDAVVDNARSCFSFVNYTKDICHELTKLQKTDPDGFDGLVYNARNPMSRRLADWWEKHQEWDNRRRAQEEAEQKRKELVEAAKAKLTKEELAALAQSFQKK